MVMAVICGVFIFLLPFSFLMWWVAYKSHVTIRQDKIVIRWLGTREIPWEDFASFQWARAAGAVGVAMRPMSYTLKSGKTGNIAAGVFETAELLEELATHTGLEVPR